MIIFLFIFLLFSILLEGTATALPLVLICLICMTVAMKDSFIFLPAFIAGIFLDVFALRPIGETSIFLLLAVFVILLYQRKYEINSYPFVFMASFVGSYVFLILFGYSGVLIQAGASAVIAVLLFALMRYTNQQFSI